MDVNDVVSSCNSCCYMYQVYPTPPDLILQKAVSASKLDRHRVAIVLRVVQ